MVPASPPVTEEVKSDLAPAGVKASQPARLPRFFLACLAFVLLLALLPVDIFDWVRLGGQECSKIDPITGFIHLQDKRIIWKQEGFSSGKTNSLGFLDKEFETTKPPGVFRIACLGDSMTESLQVPQEKRFSNLLESDLNKSGLGKFEVLNFGVSAAGTGQEYLTYLEYVRRFHPDLLMLFFDSGDEDKNGRKPLMSQWHPHVVFSLENGQLVASWNDFDSWLNSVQGMPVALFENARMQNRAWGMILQALNTVKTNDAFIDCCDFLARVHLLGPVEDGLTSTFPLSRYGTPSFQNPADLRKLRQTFCLQNGIVYGDSKVESSARFNEKDFEFGADPIYHTRVLSAPQKLDLKTREESRWILTETILQRLAAECKKNGTKLVVFGFPPMVNKEGFDQAFGRVASLADNRNFFAANVTQAFDQQCAGLKDSPRIVCHLSDSGHQAFASVLEGYLIDKGLVQRAADAPVKN